MQDYLQQFADWVTYSILGLVQGSPACIFRELLHLRYDQGHADARGDRLCSCHRPDLHHPAESEEMGGGTERRGG